MSAVTRKVQIALDLLIGLVENGMEFPDAHTYAVENSGLTDAEATALTDAYDDHCNDQQGVARAEPREALQ